MRAKTQMRIEKEIDEAFKSWTGGLKGPAKFQAYGDSYVVSIEAKDPEESHKWRITVENRSGGEEKSIGPVLEEDVPDELADILIELVLPDT